MTATVLRLHRPSIVELVTILLIAGIVGVFAYDEFHAYRGSRHGRDDARDDLASGVLRFKVGGKPQPWRSNLVRLTRERHGVDIEFVYACCPTTYQASYAHAYNDLMTTAIAEQSPSFSLDMVFNDARSEWIATIPD